MPLSKKAQEVVDMIAKVNASPLLEKYLMIEEDSTGWLPMDNILNGHVPNVDPEFLKLMDEFSLVLHGNMISERGSHSNTYYELKSAGYNFCTGEKDNFGPLSTVYRDKNHWSVCFG